MSASAPGKQPEPSELPVGQSSQNNIFTEARDGSEDAIVEGGEDAILEAKVEKVYR